MRLSRRLVLCVFAVAIVLTAVLSVLDTLFTGDPKGRGEVAIDFLEMLVLSAAMVASAVLVDRLRSLEESTSNMSAELANAAEAGNAWRAQSEHLFHGLSAAVASQFDTWGLTEAETEVASFILKGAALKDIATLRKTTETTIRQQAQSIYRKSGLNNRAELSAYFLEDLFDVAGARAAFSNSTTATH